MKVFLLSLVSIASLLVIGSCKKPITIEPPIITDTQPTVFYKGADVSWVTEMENAGKKFYNTSGIQQDLF